MKFSCVYVLLLISFQTLNAQHFLFNKKCIGNIKADSLFHNIIYIEKDGAEINNRLTYNWQVHFTYMYNENGLLEKQEIFDAGDYRVLNQVNRVIRYFYDDNGDIYFKLIGPSQSFLGIKKFGEKYNEDYVFDLHNKIMVEKNSLGLETYDYDLNERIVYVHQQNKLTTKVQFDENGNKLLREFYRSGQLYNTALSKYEDGNLIQQLSINHQKLDSTFFFYAYDNQNRLSSLQTIKKDSIIKQHIYSYPDENIKLRKSLYKNKEESTITITAIKENQFLDFSFEKAIRENITSIRFNDSKGNVIKIYTFMPDGERVQITEHHIEYYK